MYHMYADDFLLHTKLTTKSHINNSILSRCRNDVNNNNNNNILLQDQFIARHIMISQQIQEIDLHMVIRYGHRCVYLYSCTGIYIIAYI